MINNFRIIVFICILSIIYIYSTNISLAADLIKVPAPPTGLKIGMGLIPYNPGGPYPPSTKISGVTWDFGNVVTTGTGSDLWSVAWTADNTLWMDYGDGGGPNGNNTECRTHFGLVKANGSPPNFTWTPTWGCKADGTGCEDWGDLTHNAACDAPYGGSLSDYGVADAIFGLDNTIYAFSTASDQSEMKISNSTDFGHSWTSAAWTWSKTLGSFSPSSIVSFGMGGAGSIDTYAYITGGKAGDQQSIYMARCPKTELMTQGSWQYFTGTSGSPSWGLWANATPIHTDANRVGYGGGGQSSDYTTSRMQYFAPLSRYILTTNGGQMQQMRMYDAPAPWGPWTTAYYSDTWGNYGVTLGLVNNIIPKFISSDGTQFYMTFSGITTPINYDHYFLIKGTLNLRTGP